jgi:hypothetical protein
MTGSETESKIGHSPYNKTGRRWRPLLAPVLASGSRDRGGGQRSSMKERRGKEDETLAGFLFRCERNGNVGSGRLGVFARAPGRADRAGQFFSPKWKNQTKILKAEPKFSVQCRGFDFAFCKFWIMGFYTVAKRIIQT